MRKTFIAVALVALVALVAGPAMAGGRGGGKGGGKPKPGGGTGTITPAWTGDAHWNQVVRFNVSTTATTEPWVHLRCYQGGLVSEGWEGYFERSLSDGNFGLSSPLWTGGDADCTADLTTPQRAVLGSTSFHVYA